jgi:hypothetical protein
MLVLGMIEQGRNGHRKGGLARMVISVLTKKVTDFFPIFMIFFHEVLV